MAYLDETQDREAGLTCQVCGTTGYAREFMD